MSTATYEQATGLFTIETPHPVRFVGYSGRGNGRNNGSMEAVRSVGPIPKGFYKVGLPYHSPTKGFLTFRLTPDEANVMYGRSGFLIHGDNALGDASHGCIILPRHVRELIARHHVRTLRVVGLMQQSCAA